MQLRSEKFADKIKANTRTSKRVQLNLLPVTKHCEQDLGEAGDIVHVSVAGQHHVLQYSIFKDYPKMWMIHFVGNNKI